jgi:hypothetical protein
MAIQQTPGGVIFTGAADTRLFSMLAQKHALKLEILGMTRRGRSVYSIVKEQYKLTGNKAAVLAKLEALIELAGEARICSKKHENWHCVLKAGHEGDCCPFAG